MTRRTASTRSVDGALPQLAQPAIQGGRHAAAQIRRLLAGEPPEPMAYKDKGTVASIGRNASVRYLTWPGRLNVIVGDPP
jgi:NADH:ubiquinone reductase (H+-translocating)